MHVLDNAWALHRWLAHWCLQYDMAVAMLSTPARNITKAQVVASVSIEDFLKSPVAISKIAVTERLLAWSIKELHYVMYNAHIQESIMHEQHVTTQSTIALIVSEEYVNRGRFHTTIPVAVWLSRQSKLIILLFQLVGPAQDIYNAISSTQQITAIGLGMCLHSSHWFLGAS